MLKRTRETVRAVAESAGIMAPSVTDAQAAFDERSRQLVTGEAALSEMQNSELPGLYDRGAAPQEIEACRARIADKRIEVDHLRETRKAAGRRLAKATEAAAGTAIVRETGTAGAGRVGRMLGEARFVPNERVGA